MARVYKRKLGSRSYRNQPSDVIEGVLNKIVNGEMSILAASKQYHIPYGTLYNRYNGLHGNKPGGQPILNEAEEKLLLAAVTKSGDWGSPLTLVDMR